MRRLTLASNSKSGGYKWNNGDDGRPRCWYRDLAAESYKAELAYISEHVLETGNAPKVVPITAFERLSSRC
jgi:DNA polymerase-3 subunit epsilon